VLRRFILLTFPAQSKLLMLCRAFPLSPTIWLGGILLICRSYQPAA
jgi:hypothetical protein